MAAERGWEELRSTAANSDLAILGSEICQAYDVDFQHWLDSATTPLPETLRLNPLRYDYDWTKNLLAEIGGSEIQWYSAKGGAFHFPWYRGKPDDVNVKPIMQALHETGRVTRQEAASMLPIIIASPKPEETLLDMCAAPGSKTTQAMVAMEGKGLVLANEVHSKRANMLGTNIGRMGLPNAIVCRHDGRHFPRVPEPGFDVVIADVPCTGSATVRKNGGLWRRWKTTSSSGIQRLQIDIATRGARLLRPGGRLVYSTCSIDVTENEAVVAEILNNCPWLSLQNIDESILPGLHLYDGFSDWPELKNYGKEICDELTKCRRLPIGGEANTGGFFVALFKHEGEGEIADALIYDKEMKLKIGNVPALNEHTPTPIDHEMLTEISQKWPIEFDHYSLWKRGKRVCAGTTQMKSWLYELPIYGGKGRIWPGNNWHPLNIIHSGLPILEERSGTLRTKSAAMPILRDTLQHDSIELTNDQFSNWLTGPGPSREELKLGEEKGSVIISFDSDIGKIVVPGWLGELLTPMIDAKERLILEIQSRGL